MTINYFCIFFMIFGFIGWIWETFCELLHTGEWQDKGFLYGPICPIYGFEACGAILVTYLLETMQIRYSPGILFFGYALGSAVFEYGASYFLEKKFKAVWWDYSNMLFSINGRVCLLTTIFYGIICTAITYKVYPLFASLPLTVNNDELIVLLSLGAFGLLCADVILTAASLSTFTRRTKEVELGLKNKTIQLDFSEKIVNSKNMSAAQLKAFEMISDSTKRAVSRIEKFKR